MSLELSIESLSFLSVSHQKNRPPLARSGAPPPRDLVGARLSFSPFVLSFIISNHFLPLPHHLFSYPHLPQYILLILPAEQLLWFYLPPFQRPLNQLLHDFLTQDFMSSALVPIDSKAFLTTTEVCFTSSSYIHSSYLLVRIPSSFSLLQDLS